MGELLRLGRSGIQPSRPGQLSLAVPLQVGKVVAVDDYGHH